MKTAINELGIIDKTGNRHPVIFKDGLNVITGKSSTGKSAIIEIFDYCFGCEENTIPKGVITDNAVFYYLYMNINGDSIVIARDPSNPKKAFYKTETGYNPALINRTYFDAQHFISLTNFKVQLRSYFLDINEVDSSLIARERRVNNQKTPTPSIRSFTSYILQHQNLVANKHALFYRFDEKEKREQVIDHTKIFLGLVDQEYFFLSQERERLEGQEKSIKFEIERSQKVIEKQKEQVEPLLLSLYANMGFSKYPLSVEEILRQPQNAREELENFIKPETAEPLSDAVVQRQLFLESELSQKTAELRSLQRKAGSITKSIQQAVKFSTSFDNFSNEQKVQIANSTCPFCNLTNTKLSESAEILSHAIKKLSNDLSHAKSMKSKLESILVETNRKVEKVKNEITTISSQLTEIKKHNSDLESKRRLYEIILTQKVKLFLLLESLSIPSDEESNKDLSDIKQKLKEIRGKLSQYDIKKGLEAASQKVNSIMAEIGQDFDFEDGYKPINLHFSFESFDLYHLDEKGDKIFLRSMGSGANWLYSHITLFLALHKYFATLGNKCSIPSILFIDQPTQVYFPSFKFDKEISFQKDVLEKIENRSKNERQVDDDMKAVENLFSQFSIFCTNVGQETGIIPQIIVTDHADNLTLSDGTKFEDHVNGNRWRTRGLLDPLPEKNV